MAAFVGNKATEKELLDLHRNLQVAMQALIADRNVDHAENLLRTLDANMSRLINKMIVIQTPAD